MREIRALSILAAGLLVAGCASAGERTATGGGNVLTEEEIVAAAGISSAYEAVERLRPRWMRQSRGLDRVSGQTVDEVVIYMDGSRIGQGWNDLRHVSVDTVVRMRWIGPQDALTRFGGGHGGGAVEITTTRSR